MLLALYPRFLGPLWHELDAPVRRAHLNGEPFCGVGSFRVRHGTGHLERLLAWLLRMPSATECADTQLIVTPLGPGERWLRSFDGRSFVIAQRAADGCELLERIGPLELRFRLEVRDGALLYRQASAALRFGPLRVPLSPRLAPRVEAREEPAGADRTHVLVVVSVPYVRFLLSYEGHMEIREVRQ